MYMYLRSKNEGADQLCGVVIVQLIYAFVLFSHMQKARFLMVRLHEPCLSIT